MMKKAKTALLLVLALVFMLQSVGMPAAKAEVISKLTVDYIFDGLGEALNYGIVAEEYTQANHAESSVFVDKLVKAADTPFLNTETTYMYGRAYPLYATVSAPSGKSLQGMKFALFTANGSEMTMCEGTLTTIEEDTNVTAVGWRFDEDSPYLLHELYVRQVEKDDAGEYQIVQEGQWNSASLQVSYGPDISTAAPSSSYIGSMETGMEVGSSIKFYNTMAHNPPIEFGPGARLCVKKYKYEWRPGWFPGTGSWERVEDGYIDVTEGKNIRLSYGEEIDQDAQVYIQYGEGRDKKYAKFEDKIFFESKVESSWMGSTEYSGSFYFEEGGKRNYLEITSTKEKDKAAKLLRKAREFSTELGNMEGGVVKYDPASGISLINTEPSLLGNSTVTGPEDANGNIVSLYTVKLDNWAFNEKALQDSIGQQKILIASNEYVVFNVICDEKTGYVDMLPSSLDMYIYEAGKADQAQWGKEDSGASDRVLFNFVYLDNRSGTYKPFEGTINPTSQHGGTVLAPSADIEVLGDPPNGALVGKTISNSGGTEIHQRTMTSPAQTTWVNMVGLNAPRTGEIKLVKKQGTTLENLSGATFAVYSDKACTRKVGTDQTTDAKGTALFKDLKPGTYYVKEIKAPAGYTLDSTVHTVEVYAGVTALVGTKGYVTNTSGRGTLMLTKVDADDANVKLADAKFGLYTQTGKTFNESTAKLVQTLTTNSSGKITVRVEAGEYWIREIEAPFGYDLGLSQAKKITVKAGETTVVATGNGVVTNEKLPTGTLKVTKVDLDDTTKKLNDAEFAVYTNSECTRKVATFKTANGGVAEVELPIGTYWVREITAPHGYELDSATKHEVTIKAGKTTEMGEDGLVTNEITKAEAKLKKITGVKDFWGNLQGAAEACSGAEFTVYNNSACGDEHIVATGLTDENGELVFKLAPGQYWIKETRAPIGYEIGNTAAKDFWVRLGATTLIPGDMYANGESVFFNGKKSGTGDLVLYKVDAETKQKQLNGAEFMIYNDEDCTDPVSRQVFVTKDVGQHKGRLDIKGLEPGTYYLREEKAPDGYMLPSPNLPIEVKIEQGKETRVNGDHGVVTNEAYEVELIDIKVTKVWAGDEDVKDTVRPASITATLLQGGVAHETVAVLNAANNWIFTWKDLPVEENGVKIDYQIIEDVVVPGYTAEYSGSADEGFVITNTYEEQGTVSTTRLFFQKHWAGDETVANDRPASITVKLLANGVEYDAATVTGGEAWSWSWDELPEVDENGEAISYTLEEVSVPGYTVSIEQDADDPTSWNIYNTYVGEEAEETSAQFNASKQLVNGLLMEGQFSFQLMDEHGNVLQTKANAADGSITFDPIVFAMEDLEGATPDANGVIRKEINYTICEIIPADAVQNEDGEIVHNGISYDRKAYTATAVLLYDPSADSLTVGTGYNTEDGSEPVFTNMVTSTINEAWTFVKVTKVWNDNNNAAGIRPESVSVYLVADGVAQETPAVLNADNDWSYEWTELPVEADGQEITYTVKEKNVPGYASSITGNDIEGFTITNTLAEGTFDLEFTKTLLGGNDLPEGETRTFTFKLYEFDHDVKGAEVGSTTITLPYDGSVYDVLGTIAFDMKYGEHFYLLEEEVGNDGDILYDSQKYKLMYYALVDRMPNGENPGELVMEDYAWEYYPAREDGAVPDSLHFTNTWNGEKTYLNVRKIWEDNDNAAQARPESVTLILLANGEEYATAEVNGSTGWEHRWENLPKTDATGATIEYSVSEKPVPGYTSTTVQGVVNLRYWNVVNTYAGESQLGMLKICKSDRLNPDKKLAGAQYTLFTQETCKEEEILVLPDGTKAVITTGADGWGTLTGVPYGTYWVKETKAPAGYEVDPESYKVEVKAGAEEPVQVQVSDLPLRGALSLSKTVVADSKTGDSFLFDIVLSRNDNDPIAGSYEATLNDAAAEKVTFTADGKTAKATVSLKDGETLVIYGLRAGTTYVVTEQPNVLYDVQVNGAAANAATGTISHTALAVAKFQNTLKQVSFTVKKEWNGLAEGEKAPAIKLTLYCNGKAYPAVTPAPDKNGWYTFTGLPAYVEGKLAVYTVKEEPVTGFTTTYLNKGENAAVTDCAHNGSTIVNSKIPQTGDSTPLALWMLTALLAAFGLVGVTVALRKREN